MTDKKEILDYLRNQQKAAEIEAKVNGVNLWVLLGAIGVVAWQFLGGINFEFFAHGEMALRFLLATEAIFLLGWVCSSFSGVRPELRYESWRVRDVESPLLLLVEGAWTLLPPVLFLIAFKDSKGAGVLTIYGVLTVFIALPAIWKNLVGASSSKDRFPKPNFEQSSRTNATVVLLLLASLGYAVTTEVQAMLALSAQDMPLKSIVLLATLYLLVWVALRRHRSSRGIRWTYELETDLLIGSISPAAALRKIEYRALGPKLEDVMNQFFVDLNSQFADFDAFMADGERQISALLTEVPENFKFERLGRMKDVTDTASQKVHALSSEVQQFLDYIGKLSEKESDARVKIAIQSLVEQGDSYKLRLRQSKERIERLIQRNR